VGLGVEPGMADIFARYAQDHLFDEIEEIGIRDGANLKVHGYEFAPNFSIWTTIEECLNPPVVWEQSRGWFTTMPFSEPEVFEFPMASERWNVSMLNIGVLLIPRW
jgi:saccharopine dehydrogenase-like NADP-dependent oxidoreductase